MFYFSWPICSSSYNLSPHFKSCISEVFRICFLTSAWLFRINTWKICFSSMLTVVVVVVLLNYTQHLYCCFLHYCLLVDLGGTVCWSYVRMLLCFTSQSAVLQKPFNSFKKVPGTKTSSLFWLKCSFCGCTIKSLPLPSSVIAHWSHSGPFRKS